MRGDVSQDDIQHRYDSLKKRFDELSSAKLELERALEDTRAELRRSSETWNQTFDSVRDLIYILDGDRTIVHANRAMLERLGLPLADIIGRYCYEVLHESCSPPDDCPQLTLHSGEGCYSGDLYIERLEGFFTVTGTPLVNLHGVQVGSVHICHDITERKLAEDALLQSERNYRELIEHARTVIMRWDTNGEITYINDFGEKCFGYRRSELIGHNMIGTIVPDQDTSGRDMSELLNEIVSSVSEHRESENENVTRDGRRIWMRWSNAAVYDDAGNMVEILSIGNDVTERREAEEKLHEIHMYLEKAVRRSTELAAEAANANAAKSSFLANMSHELRTPMNGVIAMAGLLSGTQLSEEQSDYVGVIRKSGRQLMAIINDILDYSKIEARRMGVEEVRFGVGEVVSELYSILKPVADEKCVDFKCRIAGDVPPYLHGDPAKLRQVLLNLASNAIKFTEHGWVEVQISLKARDEYGLALHFEVSDTGIGIPADQLPNIFEPFTQADSSTTRRFGGTGLGLSISRQLVELMGGSLEVSSREGEGAVFCFDLGFAGDQAVVSEFGDEGQSSGFMEKSVGSSGSRRNYRILVVEDNLINQRVAGALLEKSGYAYAVVESGYEALSRMENESFDLVLMDCQMPGLDGYETTTLIRSANLAVVRNDIPIIAMTANAMEGEREKCLAAGMNDYISKPIELSNLLPLLDRWLSADRGDTVEAAAADPPQKCTDAKINAARPQVPIFNEVDYLRRNLDDRGLSQDVLKIFVSNTPGYLEALSGFLADGDAIGLRKQAHAVKGACSTVGAEQMRDIALGLELLGKNGELAGAEAGIEQLHEAFQCLKEELVRLGWLL